MIFRAVPMPRVWGQGSSVVGASELALWHKGDT